MHSKYNHSTGRRQPFKRNQVNRFYRYFGHFPALIYSICISDLFMPYLDYVQSAGLFRETSQIKVRELSVDITGVLHQNGSVGRNRQGDPRIP
jgi:hypothetical protein